MVFWFLSGRVISPLCVTPSEMTNYYHSSWRSSDCCIQCGQAKEQIPLLVGLNKSLQVKKASVLVKHNQKKGKSNPGGRSFSLKKNPCSELIENLGLDPFQSSPCYSFEEITF